MKNRGIKWLWEYARYLITVEEIEMEWVIVGEVISYQMRQVKCCFTPIITVCEWVCVRVSERGREGARGFSGWKMWVEMWIQMEGHPVFTPSQMHSFHCRLLDGFWPQCYSRVCEIKEKPPKPLCFDSFNRCPVCPLPAPVPVWGAKEAAITGHRTDHLTGQQLVSALSINTLILALWLINNQLNCRV